MNDAALECLKRLTALDIWWQTPDQAMQFPEMVAQVMNLGDYSDVLDRIEATGEDYFPHVLQQVGSGS